MEPGKKDKQRNGIKQIEPMAKTCTDYKQIDRLVDNGYLNPRDKEGEAI